MIDALRAHVAGPDAERVDLAGDWLRAAPGVQLRAGATGTVVRTCALRPLPVAAVVAPLHGRLQLRVRQRVARRVADAGALHRQRFERAAGDHDGLHAGARRHAHPQEHRLAALRHRHRRATGLLCLPHHVQGGPCEFIRAHTYRCQKLIISIFLAK